MILLTQACGAKFLLTEGKAHDVTAYHELMEQRDSDPGVMLMDKGYDSDPIRQDLRDRGTAPEIPTKRNRNRRAHEQQRPRLAIQGANLRISLM